MIFLLIILGLPTLDVLWWLWADRKLRPLNRQKLWRSLLAAFMGFQVAGYAGFIVVRMLRMPVEVPPVILMGIYIWHLLILPVTVLATLAYEIVRGGYGLLFRPAAAGQPAAEERADGSVAGRVSRRQVLVTTAAVLPPLLTAGTVGAASVQLGSLRVREMQVPISKLPAELNGLTIAHLTDSHVGRFTRGAKLHEIAAQTNALEPDLIVFTGDLIDYSLADLPEALGMLAALRPRLGMYMCEGNHDLFDDPRGFRHGVLASGLPLLLNTSRSLTIRGQAVQILGLRWGGMSNPRSPMLEENFAELRSQIRPDAFPILMAHHPHAFDVAREAGLPLTLTGHTHGGQVMLTENVGPGPVLFKYWSGLYQRGASSLVVANGVGNWFPLRLNAPAEVIHMTLVRAEEPG